MLFRSCLNFASPEKPEGFWQFRRAVEGLADACEALGTPVISGNVSFYNETPERAIYPTPTVGMIGLLPDAGKRVTMGFKNEGDLIYLIGGGEPTLGGSEYLAVVHGQEVGKPPALDMEAEKRLQAFLREAIDQKLLQSAHDVSDGGLTVALAECCISGGRGAWFVHAFSSQQAAGARELFGEANSLAIVSVTWERRDELQQLMETMGVPFVAGGYVDKDNLRINAANLSDIQNRLHVAVADLRAAYEGAIPAAMTAGAETA